MPSASPAPAAAPKLGIVAGGGRLPARLIEACRDSGRDYFVIAVEGFADPETVAGTPHAWVRLGAAGRALEAARSAGVVEIVLAGRISRPSLSDLRPDFRAATFLARVGMAALGDDGLLRAVVRNVEDLGFTVVGAHTILADLLAPEGTFGKLEADEAARSDIAVGIAAACELGARDLGQAAVVQGGKVLGLENRAGTDDLIGRAARHKAAGPGPILVKVKKPIQDPRVDLPAIGTRTVELASAHGYRGIAVEAGGAIVLDRAAVAALADEKGLFVVGVPVP